MIRSWDTVSAGAFFPQAQLETPQKKVRQHRREHMVVPPCVFAHFILSTGTDRLHARNQFKVTKV
jgi:hypothetical protein